MRWSNAGSRVSVVQTVSGLQSRRVALLTVSLSQVSDSSFVAEARALAAAGTTDSMKVFLDHICVRMCTTLADTVAGLLR